MPCKMTETAETAGVGAETADDETVSAKTAGAETAGAGQRET